MKTGFLAAVAVLAGTAMGTGAGQAAPAQATIELPVEAGYCAIHYALTRAPGPCAPDAGKMGIVRSIPANGATRAAIPLGKDETEAGYFIRFAFNSSTLEPDYRAHLDRLAMVLASDAMSGLCVHLVGHTDTVGRDTYNLALSNRRAASVFAYLRAKPSVGVARIRAYGRGEAQPLPDVAGTHGLNRRVEILAKPLVGGSCT